MKTLIYYSEYLQERKGGPSTYLFNLREGLRKCGDQSIAFCHPIDNSNSNGEPKGSKKILKKILPYNIRRLFRVIQFLIKCKIGSSLLTKEMISSYDIIHFHTSFDLYRSRKVISKFKGLVFLSSHSPKPQHLEQLEDLFYLKENSFLRKLTQPILEKYDLHSFNIADKIVFPCEGAIEPYALSWNCFDNIPKEKFEYLPTGSPSVEFKKTRSEIREEFNIPKDAFVISYLGRHNEIKGYDLLKEFGESILSKNDNVYFLIAGKEFPIKGLRNRNWVEVGWTNDPHSLVNASDLFILPNRQTYFDLVLLEVLSLRKKVLISDCGGNKYFSKFKSNLINYFKTGSVESLEEQFVAILESASSECVENYEYLNEFTLDSFTKRYIELYKSFLN